MIKVIFIISKNKILDMIYSSKLENYRLLGGRQYKCKFSPMTIYIYWYTLHRYIQIISSNIAITLKLSIWELL